MATWGQILAELQQSAQARGVPDFDAVRRKYLAELHSETGRDTIIYYSDWLAGTSSDAISITLEDVQALMEVCRGLKGPDLDLVLHTPGGSAEATASVLHYLREKFTGHIRVFVPVAAMSAGTMWALGCDEIVMGRHSQLGPIDPQVSIGGRYTPARAVVEQFEQAKEETVKNPAVLATWYPILQQYGPGLLAICADAEQLSKSLVKGWLKEHMCAADPDAAERISEYFGDYKEHRSHSLGIMADKVKSLGVNVTALEAVQSLQDAVLSVHHATMHTLSGPCVKLVENHLGNAYVKLSNTIAIPAGMQMGFPGMLPVGFPQA